MTDLLPLSQEQRDRIANVLRGNASIATLLSSEELHYVARSWNWDDGIAPLRELVLRDDCALATASLVFWKGLPDEVVGSYATRDEAEEETGTGDVHDLQILLRDRIASGAYASHGIGYDPSDDDGTDWVEDYPAKPKHALPAALTSAVPGRFADPAIRF